ncbi:MAG: cell division protein FtsZ [Candidatus Lokiarchaeota archaeon]|nr:cell division protein FtsZ [Candidatus Lokiarchaeota archaeon]MBD3342947.1 cell division protein FtsZ [Candidatus Lokiarchaeota archaeon]
MESLIKNARRRVANNTRKENIGFANIKIIGCGGAGNNTIDRLMKIGIRGAKCIAINTDRQHLDMIDAHMKILIGKTLTRGLGAGGNPDVGKAAAEETKEELINIIRDTDLVFITCGEGGGTGTGSAPIVAEIAKMEEAIVVGVVTIPFETEIGRIEKAKQGLNQLKQYVDTLVVIDNNRLLEIAPDLPIIEAFSVADEVLASMVKGITETISLPSLINLDFADVKTILSTGGVAIVGVGESNSNENRVEEAIDDALNLPLLDVDIEGAKGALIHVCGGNDMTLAEANSVAQKIYQKMDVNDSMVIWGARVSDEFKGILRVMLLITGIKSPQIFGHKSDNESFSSGDESKSKFGLAEDIFDIEEIAFD